MTTEESEVKQYIILAPAARVASEISLGEVITEVGYQALMTVITTFGNAEILQQQGHHKIWDGEKNLQKLLGMRKKKNQIPLPSDYKGTESLFEEHTSIGMRWKMTLKP